MLPYALLAASPVAMARDHGGALARVTVAARTVAKAPAPVPTPLGGDRFVDGRGAPMNYVAFTFDDGPSAVNTPGILKALDEHGVRATFFVCGYKWTGKSLAKRLNSATLQAIVAGGHTIGNHSFGHKRMTLLDDAAAVRQIADNDAAIARVIGQHPRLYRPPYGELTRATQRFLDDAGYTVVKWNRDVLDFQLYKSKEIRDGVLALIKANQGGIVVLHDTHPASVKAFPLILAGLEEENCDRLAAGKEPILPVELDYFALAADGSPLPIPADVAARTTATRERLTRRCTEVSKSKVAKQPKARPKRARK